MPGAPERKILLPDTVPSGSGEKGAQVQSSFVLDGLGRPVSFDTPPPSDWLVGAVTRLARSAARFALLGATGSTESWCHAGRSVIYCRFIPEGALAFEISARQVLPSPSEPFINKSAARAAASTASREPAEGGSRGASAALPERGREKCIKLLAEFIGPAAGFVLQKSLAEAASSGSEVTCEALIRIVAEKIPDARKKESFIARAEQILKESHE